MLPRTGTGLIHEAECRAARLEADAVSALAADRHFSLLVK